MTKLSPLNHHESSDNCVSYPDAFVIFAKYLHRLVQRKWSRRNISIQKMKLFFCICHRLAIHFTRQCQRPCGCHGQNYHDKLRHEVRHRERFVCFGQRDEFNYFVISVCFAFWITISVFRYFLLIGWVLLVDISFRCVLVYLFFCWVFFVRFG